MVEYNNIDVAIAGGGLAGLSLAILCAKEGYKTILIEKGNYPRHKVCGEYISRESINFMESLGLDIDRMQLPKISKFTLTSHYGMAASTVLKPGGIGISRYKLDYELYLLAKQNGVVVLENEKVTTLSEQCIKTNKDTHIYSKIIIAAFGRQSGFINSNLSKNQTSYIGVKFHVDKGPEKDMIEIHNFKGGYCGISAIEDDKYCMCYLAKTSAFKDSNKDFEVFEDRVLKQNPYLKERLKAKKIIEQVTTSQLFFGNNESKDYPLLGDAAGFIPPITGNGMSLAFRSAKNAFNAIKESKLDLKTSKLKIENYNKAYLKNRINKGIFLQNILFIENDFINKMLMYSLNNIPGLLYFMSKNAIGEDI